ncbi:hypothetical protein DV737_g483, partial [Chaetothyriales sp. CBS 132003]
MAESRQAPGVNPLRPYYVPPTAGNATAASSAATAAATTRASSAPAFAFPDIDYSDYIPEASPSVTGSIKKLLDQAVWKYLTVLMAQPLEVAKLILQARPLSGAPGPATHVPAGAAGRIDIKNSHSLLEALSSLAASSGALSMWRGTNATLIYSVLSRALEPFLRSFLAALAGVAEPDLVLPLPAPGLPDSGAGLSSSAPIPAVIISTAACALTSLVLAPIDAARTRLILTAEEPRSLLGVLRTLSPSWLIPSHLIATWTAPSPTAPVSQPKRKPVATIVRVPQSYRGILPAMWGIVREEGYSESQKDKLAHLAGRAPRRRRKGQGIEGLYRGWRVGLWALVGVWGTGFVGGVSAQAGDTGAGGGVHGGKF